MWRRYSIVILGIVLVFLAACTRSQLESGTGFGTLAASDVKISEIRIDQPSEDTDEYVELVGPAETSLDGLSYLVIGDTSGGGSGVIEGVLELSGNSITESGLFVAAESTFGLGSADMTGALNFENGDNVTHLLVSGFSGANGDDLDTNDDGALDATPWSEVIDKIALIVEENPPSATEYHYGPPSVGPDGDFVPAHAFRCDDGWRIGAFDPADGSDTPGTANACEEGGPGDEDEAVARKIHEIQGSGEDSPLENDTVTIEGVVVGDFQGAGELNGFFVQEEASDADGDPATSEGIFVFDGDLGVNVRVGSRVSVTGTVTEFFGLTELEDVTDVTVLDNNVALPEAATVSLPLERRNDLERFEGMRVTFPQELTVTETYDLGRFGEVSLSAGGRLYTPTNVAEPGEEAAEVAAANDMRRILLDDARGGENLEPIAYPAPKLAAANTLRLGDTVSDLTGVLSYGFSQYRVQPTETPDFVHENPRTREPEEVGGSLRVASFNVLNYFNGNGMGGGFPTSRGADTLEEFQRQRAKIVNAIKAMDADIVGLIELENDGYGAESAIADLVNTLNATGKDNYAFIDPGVERLGTDEIAVGFIYRPATVEPVGDAAILNSSVDPRFNDDKNRPVLAQTFREKSSGEVLTVAVNHLKSKGSDCDNLGDPDTGDGQGNCNVTRTMAAEALVDWLATDPTGSGDPDALIIGDLNAYAKEDPIDAIKAAGYMDLVNTYQGEDAYSYVFFGQAGYLDHALADETLAPQVRGTTIWHINSDEPRALDYNTDYYDAPYLYKKQPYRSSDHDPVVVGLDLFSPSLD